MNQTRKQQIENMLDPLFDNLRPDGKPKTQPQVLYETQSAARELLMYIALLESRLPKSNLTEPVELQKLMSEGP